jgi:hypothetical protein
MRGSSEALKAQEFEKAIGSLSKCADMIDVRMGSLSWERIF